MDNPRFALSKRPNTNWFTDRLLNRLVMEVRVAHKISPGRWMDHLLNNIVEDYPTPDSLPDPKSVDVRESDARVRVSLRTVGDVAQWEEQVRPSEALAYRAWAVAVLKNTFPNLKDKEITWDS